jgi:hypothetical protein
VRNLRALSQLPAPATFYSDTVSVVHVVGRSNLTKEWALCLYNPARTASNPCPSTTTA